MWQISLCVKILLSSALYFSCCFKIVHLRLVWLETVSKLKQICKFVGVKGSRLEAIYIET